MTRHVLLVATILVLVSLTLAGYRIVRLGYPVVPSVPGSTWMVALEVQIGGEGRGVTMSAGLPIERPGQTILAEQITSGSLVFEISQQDDNRLGTWSGPLETESEFLAHRSTILVGTGRARKSPPPRLHSYPEGVSREERELAERLAGSMEELPARDRLRAIAATVTGNWGSRSPRLEDVDAWASFEDRRGRPVAILALLRASHLSARPVQGLQLTEATTVTPLQWIEVWTGRAWEVLRPRTGEIEPRPVLFLPLAVGDMPPIQIFGGQITDLRWQVSRQALSHWLLHFDRIRRSNHLLDRWSLFRLPPEFQETFRILLLVPIGALMIAALRNFVGFSTFGIFMPVLMALAFRNTGLIYGLGIFSLIIAIGYGIRRILNRLRLLLVPRLSVVLTAVITALTVLALVGNKLGFRELMAVGLLPFVILTMAIERFFILVEEAGTREGLSAAAGTALVAALTYTMVNWEPLQLTFFLYPEFLAAVAAIQLLLGRYTGLRLSELVRFRALGQ